MEHASRKYTAEMKEIEAPGSPGVAAAGSQCALTLRAWLLAPPLSCGAVA